MLVLLSDFGLKAGVGTVADFEDIYFTVGAYGRRDGEATLRRPRVVVRRRRRNGVIACRREWPASFTGFWLLTAPRPCCGGGARRALA